MFDQKRESKVITGAALAKCLERVKKPNRLLKALPMAIISCLILGVASAQASGVWSKLSNAKQLVAANGGCGNSQNQVLPGSPAEETNQNQNVLPAQAQAAAPVAVSAPKQNNSTPAVAVATKKVPTNPNCGSKNNVLPSQVTKPGCKNENCSNHKQNCQDSSCQDSKCADCQSNQSCSLHKNGQCSHGNCQSKPIEKCATGQPSNPQSGDQAPVLDSSASAQVLALINQERAKAGLSPLKGNALLDKTALAKSKDMSDRNYFAHVSPDGKSDLQMITDAGYKYRAAGSNIAEGDFGGLSGVVTAWMNSAGHRANILANYATEFGFGMHDGYYTMFVAKPL